MLCYSLPITYSKQAYLGVRFRLPCPNLYNGLLWILQINLQIEIALVSIVGRIIVLFNLYAILLAIFCLANVIIRKSYVYKLIASETSFQVLHILVLAILYSTDVSLHMECYRHILTLSVCYKSFCHMAYYNDGIVIKYCFEIVKSLQCVCCFVIFKKLHDCLTSNRSPCATFHDVFFGFAVKTESNTVNFLIVVESKDNIFHKVLSQSFLEGERHLYASCNYIVTQLAELTILGIEYSGIAISYKTCKHIPAIISKESAYSIIVMSLYRIKYLGQHFSVRTIICNRQHSIICP